MRPGLDSAVQPIDARSHFPRESAYYHITTYLPFLISLVGVVPLARYFDILGLSAALSATHRFGFGTYIEHVLSVLGFFWRYEMLLVAMILKLVIQVATRTFLRSSVQTTDMTLRRISFFLTWLFCCYVMCISAIPYLVFVRYYIVLQPILAAIIVLDTITLATLYAGSRSVKSHLRLMRTCVVAGVVAFTISVVRIFPDIEGHWEELRKQYKGPLDFIIPYIQEHYPHSDSLTIATNYEEFSFMVYTGSRMAVGFVGVNLAGDAALTPDIIVYRRWWANHIELFRYYASKARYRMISFPVQDYPVNNIPDLNTPLRHLYTTPAPNSAGEELHIYVKE